MPPKSKKGMKAMPKATKAMKAAAKPQAKSGVKPMKNSAVKPFAKKEDEKERKAYPVCEAPAILPGIYPPIDFFDFVGMVL